MQFALMDGSFSVAVKKFDGILDSKYMKSFFLIDLVDDGCERGGFARTGRTGDQNNPVAKLGSLLKLRRQVQLFEARDFRGDHTHDDGTTAALRENVHAKAGELRQ